MASFQSQSAMQWAACFSNLVYHHSVSQRQQMASHDQADIVYPSKSTLIPYL